MSSAKKRKVVDSNDHDERVKRLKASDGTPAAVQSSKSLVTRKETTTIETSIAATEMSLKKPDEHSEREKGKPTDASKQTSEQENPKPSKPRPKINKLTPPRPFPTVPASVSATGPRSAHKEGKNYICLTRKTPLAAYLRRCKDIILKDGYKSLHLSAMGAAIPHLLQLTVSLPVTLPFAPEEIHTQVLTGTVEVQDEVIPDDEDQDVSYQIRAKSTLSVVIKIGEDGGNELVGDASTKGKRGRGNDTPGASSSKGKKKEKEDKPEQIVLQEVELDNMDTV